MKPITFDDVALRNHAGNIRQIAANLPAELRQQSVQLTLLGTAELLENIAAGYQVAQRLAKDNGAAAAFLDRLQFLLTITDAITVQAYINYIEDNNDGSRWNDKAH